ncbi:protein Skeletor, isoforms B/C isoform X1 [Osmia bicornis bicornis]|uniref:protein Skeletor, isoforms B/C isoform X1 n=1 Tax=Osmia bicornis bicornis TaxID=1437191 RepID=UPI0010F94281|nr:protein Skeletor, isoforms B/C isoform X1 [Osmia bicornis bicornis]XP_029042534.1 protein Skeletor, isoforms B/C isoform X1 [Osmia bicornis bicornis]XP_029042535.1 protein Skeletor, isoforms B/C isoform X1 [Osmia bicornis bicornis]XP_029042536.1 protein Skeletor, isoforms B/C isoform X1 [Osmia bicornis bicornis]XP_029042537.1 protein Skeletor, isoforms B/C isoform X1 [Osmia bicornis bicornis]
MDATPLRLISVLLLFAYTTSHFNHAKNGPNYYGSFVGSLKEYGHGIKGDVYVLDSSMIFIKGFCYDGTGPDAYFWVGNTSAPSPQGYIVPYPEIDKNRDPPVLKAYNYTDIFLKLPDGKQIRDIKWLSVWCRRFTVNFGDVYIQANLTVPKTRVLPEFSRLAHGLRSENITILDSKTFYIPNLHYDGAAPNAYFWVGNGSEPNTFGVKVPSEIKSLAPLRSYQGEDIEIVLPTNLTVYDIDWLAVWCVDYKQNFGHVLIPKDLYVPPALGQTKITPPWWYDPTSSTPQPPLSKHELTNCKEMLEGRVQVQWEMIGDAIQIKVSGRIREDQYIAFGLSGQDGKAEMIGGDVVVVAYINKTGRFIAEDYYISAYAQCDGRKGVCPDVRIGGKNHADFVDGERNDGVTTVTYTRPLRTDEPMVDRAIPSTETSVIAAIGPLNVRGEANAHESFDMTTADIRIDFTSRNVHECTNSLYNLPDMPDIKPWPPILITNETTFSARIGPAAAKRGYTRLTGQPGWGIAWYINDKLIPEITVERGQTYTFIVEGGNNPTNPARYHPFYITDSPEGGFGQKTEEQQRAQRVFAGVKYDADGNPYPSAAGRYCEWVLKAGDTSANSETFESFFETLRLDCNEGQPAELNWTVTEETPDLVYYQCYQHNHLGWKIHVVGDAHAIVPLMSMVLTTLLVGILNFLR